MPETAMEAAIRTVKDAAYSGLPLHKKRMLFRAFRKQFGLTLAEFARRLDLTEGMLSKFERGRRDFSDKAWKKVLDEVAKLIVEDQAKRAAEVAKASETAQKLGASWGPGASLAFEDPEKIEKELVRVREEGEQLRALSAEQYELRLKQPSRPELEKLFAHVLVQYDTLAAKLALVEQDRDGFKRLYLAECEQTKALRKRVEEKEGG